MAPSFLPTFDSSILSSPGRLIPAPLSYLGHAFVTITPSDVDNALRYLQRTVGLHATCFDVSALHLVDDIVSILDSGARKVVVSGSQLRELERVENLDLDRVALSVSPGMKNEMIDAIAGTSVDLYVHRIKDVELVEAWLKEYGTDRPDVYVSFDTPSVENALRIANLSGIPVIPASQCTADPVSEQQNIPIATLLLANATTDRLDGLFTTIVTDERGIALGLVYSSHESVNESLRTGKGVYQSRKRGLWYKGESSGDTQDIVAINLDCDHDCLKFTVKQKGRGFCHLGTPTCFGSFQGLPKLQQTLQKRKSSAPLGSYTARLFKDQQLLKAKIMEEASELCEATTKEDVTFEAADLLYFALTKCVATGVSLEDIERNLDAKSTKVKRRKGDAKGSWAAQMGMPADGKVQQEVGQPHPTSSSIKASEGPGDRIKMRTFVVADGNHTIITKALQRPSQRTSDKIMSIVRPIIDSVRHRGDAALLEYAHKFEKATSLASPVLKAPFPKDLMQLSPETKDAIDVSFENIRKFHAAQMEPKPLSVTTMPGVECARMARPIEKVGLYVPGGTAVLPSTALMLGVPAMVAGCRNIVIASPPRADGSLTPEIVYIAERVGAETIVLAGGAQAVAALAYGTESVSKVDKILGPGNQFVTAAKMLVSNDTSACVSIDMPAGPSEVLVVADETANPAFVAADLLSQAEHGVDSQVVLIGVGLGDGQLRAIEDELHSQASALPRVDIVRQAIDHSVTLVVDGVAEAMDLSNRYAPEHLILQVRDAQDVAELVQNAGSVFVGPWTPESVGDYSAGVNHSLPTYGYARQYSGVNLGSYVKHITSSNLTAEGLRNLGGAVMQLAKVEELEAHRRAVSIRLAELDRLSGT
ncbi:histidine biosynthesis trifunctional protein [Lineolata rhizophorae]|uniref:Histidine biosynthesis trifunctional protein n=1 Tax=Lineolata rhizophorae TaxID=578093 RepID=A0A6A6NSQ2_9PEZI|nr:histidine biosynthesis trifunctional protein [Lineolata rhizophorae]